MRAARIGDTVNFGFRDITAWGIVAAVNGPTLRVICKSDPNTRYILTPRDILKIFKTTPKTKQSK